MKAPERNVAIIVLFLTVLLANRGLWLCLTDIADPESFCSYNFPGEELILYLFTSCLAIWLVIRGKMGRLFAGKWRANVILVLFIALAILSIFWSDHPTTTFYYLLILVFSTLIAASLGTIFSVERWLELLAMTGALIVIASLVVSVLFPRAVIMAAPHEGAWRGVYWHKNLTGSLMAFWNAVFLLYGLHTWRGSRVQAVASAVLYLTSLVMVFLAHSAAGIATCAGINLGILVLVLWARIRQTLKRKHYLWIGLAALILAALALANLDFVFSLLNREASLTGRMPLWEYLIETAVKQKPLLGHGIGAIWDDREFRRMVTLSQGWPFTITNSHNGFMDVLLGLGVVGLALSALLVMQALYRAGRYFIMNSGAQNLLPLVSVLYFVVANLSTSFFLMMDSFHWILLVIALFLCTPAAEQSIRNN